MNRHPIEHIDNSSRELCLLGLKVGAWIIGNIGLNLVKNSDKAIFCIYIRRMPFRKIRPHTRNPVEGSGSSFQRADSLFDRS